MICVPSIGQSYCTDCIVLRQRLYQDDNIRGNQSINIGLLKDGKTHLRISPKKYNNTKYMTMYDKIKSARIGEYDTAE